MATSAGRAEALGTTPLARRATISNVCPEYGATAALFPIDTTTSRTCV
ncbi:aconitase family protein [Streptomyces sp. NBC_00988]|nr:aconitase family protein [Streptomyces sp. NBC_00988]